jgi:uncharacterized phage-like protein YoqJ
MISKIPRLVQNVDRSLNRETQYPIEDEPKIYTNAMITGHRDARCVSDTAINRLVKMAIAQGISHFYCGMALGVDQAFARILTTYPVTWTAVIPCADQDKLWSRSQRAGYRQLLEVATKQVILNQTYNENCMRQRNLYMVKRSDLCLAVFDGNRYGKRSGTAMTLKMVQAANLLCYQYNPIDRQFLIIKPIPEPKQLSLFP